jgi:hypothetical protein
MKLARFRIGSQAYRECPSLEEPLSDALNGLQRTISTLTEGLVRMRVLAPLVVDVASNTPGTAPWPLRLAQVASSPVGVVILGAENLTTSGAAGVPTSAVSITSQRYEGETLFIDFISGLTLSSRYRFRFGVFDAG